MRVRKPKAQIALTEPGSDTLQGRQKGSACPLFEMGKRHEVLQVKTRICVAWMEGHFLGSG